MTDMQTSLPLLIVWLSILNPVINFSTHLWPVKWNALGYTFALRIPFHLLQCWCNTCTNMINNDMIHFISSRNHIGSSTLTSLAFHCCLHLAAPSLSQASPPRGPSLQSLWLALHACNWSIKPSLVLIFSTFDHMTQCHVSCAMSSFIFTCVSFATSLNHFHLHGICCSPTCTYGLITCVSHINIISPPRIVTQLSKPHKDLSISPFW